MKVTLIDYTGMGMYDPLWAARKMIFTKSTRLQMSPSLMDEIAGWPREKVMAELEYMANTIPSSWEFVDYTFMIEGVTRAFTHQLVRTRTASFAQQTMRVLDVSDGPGWDYLTGPSIDDKVTDKMQGHLQGHSRKARYDYVMKMIAHTYKDLIKSGAKVEDARGVLPTNILTNIVMKMNMRTFAELVTKRESSRTQGEYRDVLAAMKEEVLRVHPWMTIFLARTGTQAVNDLEALINENWLPVDTHKIPEERRIKMIKLLDQIRKAL